MIRILQVLPSLNYCGGVENYLINYYKNIDKTKIIFDFVYHIDSEKNFLNEIEPESKVYKLPEFSLKNLKTIKNDINNIMKKNKYDIIHCHMANAAFLYFKIAKKNGVNFRIIHSHQAAAADKFTHKLRNVPLLSLGTKRATHYFACSELAGKYLFKNKKFYIINNAVDVNKFLYDMNTRKKIRENFNMNDSTFCIGHIGRMCNQKNQLYLLEIFNSIYKKNKNTVLFLVGDGELRKIIIKKIKEYKLEDRVILTGIVSDPYVYYNVFDCFVLPSLYEGLPVVGIEAQINGLKLVVSDSITNELNFSGNVEFVNLKSSIDNWISAIELLRNSSRQKVDVDKYDIKVQSDILTNYYFQIIKREI